MLSDQNEDLDKDIDFVAKIIVIGDSGVGKSSLLECYINEKKVINEDVIMAPTLGVEFYTTFIDSYDKYFKIIVWDTAGQERFRALTRSYYRGAFGAIICFSITDRESFDNISKYIDEIKDMDDINQSEIGMYTQCTCRHFFGQR